MNRLIITFLWAIAFSYSSATLAAETAPGGKGEDIKIKMAIIDVEAVLRNAAVNKSINKQIGKYRKSFQDEIQKEEEALRNADQELGRQRTILSPEAFAAERKKFEQRVVNYQRTTQMRKNELERIVRETKKKVVEALNKAIVELANKRGLNLVINKNATYIFPIKLDITGAALKGLNKNLPTITIAKPSKIPQPTAPKPAKAPKPGK